MYAFPTGINLIKFKTTVIRGTGRSKDMGNIQGRRKIQSEKSSIVGNSRKKLSILQYGEILKKESATVDIFFLYFITLLGQKETKSVRSFFGRIYGAQICLRFYLTFKWKPPLVTICSGGPAVTHILMILLR